MVLSLKTNLNRFDCSKGCHSKFNDAFGYSIVCILIIYAELEIDHINATLVPDWRCQNAKVVRFDAAYYRRKSYAFSICDDLLSLYEVMESSVKLLQINREFFFLDFNTNTLLNIFTNVLSLTSFGN
jgi:hypothetical protein